MPLQTDPTVIYGLGPMFSGNLTKKDLQRPGDWNTYLNKGLPPTPISMPSAASIEAAAHPNLPSTFTLCRAATGRVNFQRTCATTTAR